MTIRQFSLDKEDAQSLQKIAEKLGISESEVIRKGLQIMSIVAKYRDGSQPPSLLIHRKDEEGKDQELEVNVI